MSPSVLPTPLSPIVGRERELRELSGLMASSRLITLTGVGGSGKTRLALEAVSRYAAADAPAWVDLAPLCDGGLLTDHVSRALEVHGEGVSGATQALTRSLKTRSLLLVLDNCEHLVDASARLVEVLLHFCAPLRILATSREPLGLAGERIWQVPPLSLPAAGAQLSPEELEATDAGQLFVARAREANPAFRITEKNVAAVAAICRRLDGLPLALELAAARTRVLAVEQIAERLDDTFRLLTTGGRTSLPRQRTLRGVFDWSHDLLSEEQRVLLRRLSVFSCGFSLEAVEAITLGGPIDDGNVLDALAALVDRSMVQLVPDSEPARYRLLEVVRQYGRERLQAAGEEADYEGRHADYFLRLAEVWGPLLFLGTDDDKLMSAVDRDHDNLRAVMDWAMVHEGKLDYALRIGEALHWYWYFRGHLLEGWRRMDAALKLAKKQEIAPLLQARAMVCLGVFSMVRGEAQHDSEKIATAVQLLRGAGDDRALAYALSVQAAIESLYQPEKAWQAAVEGLTLLESRPDDVLKAFACHWHGVTALGRGDLAQARASCARTVVLGHSLGHLAAIAHATYFLGLIDFMTGDAAGARRWTGQSLELHTRLDTRFAIAQALRLFGQMAAKAGDAPLALRLFGGAERLREELGSQLPPAEQMAISHTLNALRAALGRDAVNALLEEGAGLGMPGTIELALAWPGPAGPAGDFEVPGAAGTSGTQGISGTQGTRGTQGTQGTQGTPATGTSGTLGTAIAELAAALPLPPEKPAEVVEEKETFVAGALRVAALGSLRVEVAGQAKLDAQGSARTRELLVFLLLQKDGASKEEVGAALWPEASASQVRNSFHVTLHRLRGVLGHAEAIRVEGSRYSLDPAFVGFFDVPLFESRAKAALAAARAGNNVPDELLAALELYRGELLQSESAGEWHLERRDRLQQLYLEILALAGRQLRAAERLAEAAEVYRRWIAADDLAEEAYRQLMACLEARGELQEALRVYAKLAKVLQKELDVEPEEASREIYERLQALARRPR